MNICFEEALKARDKLKMVEILAALRLPDARKAVDLSAVVTEHANQR